MWWIRQGAPKRLLLLGGVTYELNMASSIRWFLVISGVNKATPVPQAIKKHGRFPQQKNGSRKIEVTASPGYRSIYRSAYLLPLGLNYIIFDEKMKKKLKMKNENLPHQFLKMGGQ